MLVLTRKIGEKLIIADDIVIQVLSVSGDQVKLGIQAPASISVHRNEVYEAIATGVANAADGKATNRPPFSRRPKPALVKKNDASE